MARRGEQLPSEVKEQISRTKKRESQRQRFLAEQRPGHVNEWLRRGLVHASLRSMIDTYTAQMVDMVQDLGGADEVSAMERALLDGWLRAAVAADVEFGHLLKHPNDGVPEKLTTCLNAARASLIALGLRRRARDVGLTLAESITIKAQAAQDAAEQTIDVTSDPNAAASSNGGAVDEVQAVDARLSTPAPESTIDVPAADGGSQEGHPNE